MGKIELRPLEDLSSFRKMALGTWKTVGDPSVYATLDIEMSKTLKFLSSYNETHNVKITPTHLVGFAITHALHRCPTLNAMLRFGKIYLRKDVDVFFQVHIDTPHGPDLSGCVVRKAQSLTLTKMYSELQRKASAIRTHSDKELSLQYKLMKVIPTCLMRYFLNFTSFLIYGLNRNFKILGLPKDPFGSVMVTSVGGFGVDTALVPLIPYSKVPLLMAVGAIQEKPWAENGSITAKPVMTIGVTFDHRFVDGAHMAHMNRDFRACFSDPERYFSGTPENISQK